MTNPLSERRTQRIVIIEVSGGVAEVTQCPDDVEVRIVDWDNYQAGRYPESQFFTGSKHEIP